MSTTQLYQNDPRWKNSKIGLQNTLTIEQVGCLLTSMAMVVNHFGANETPASLNERMKASNGFTGAWIKAAQVPGKFPQLGMQRQKHVQCEGTPAPMNLIDSSLRKGSLVVVRVDWTPDANIDSHWVVIHEKKGDEYLIWDPWQKDSASSTLMGRYGFGDKKPEDVILEVIWHGRGELEETADPVQRTTAIFKRPKELTDATKPVTETTSPTTETTIMVKPTIELKLRQQPQTGALLKILAVTETLQVLETAAIAQAKIGQQGQWLHVQDQSGVSGYVAAWFVRETAVSSPSKPSTPTMPTTPTEPTPTTTLKVQATTIQLAFRSAPYVASNTLIRYLAQSDVIDALDADAANKIGQQGQWLHVRTSNGQEGYVAAWYVQETT